MLCDDLDGWGRVGGRSKWELYVCIHRADSLYCTTETNTTVSVQSFSCVRLFETPWTAACQASLSFAISQSLFKLMSIELVMPSNHLIVFNPSFFLPSIFPSIKVFSNELFVCLRWPKYWSFSFSTVLPMNIQG